LQRWQIKDESAFLLRCGLHAPALGGVIFWLGYSAQRYVEGYASYGLEQLPMAIIFALLFSVVAALCAVLVGAVPGVLGGAALLLWSHFRAPTTAEFIIFAALSAGLLGLFAGVVNADRAVWYLPYAFAAIGAVCALALMPSVVARRILVPVTVPSAVAAPAESQRS
jgi:hypothetical protein